MISTNEARLQEKIKPWCMRREPIQTGVVNRVYTSRPEACTPKTNLVVSTDGTASPGERDTHTRLVLV
jgi:hypothetical protein